MTTVEDADEYACQLYVCKLLEIIETAPRHLWKDILITFTRCVEAELAQG
jgi:hypothetical protein